MSNPIYHPSWDAFCPRCGTQILTGTAKTTNQQIGMANLSYSVCDFCATQVPCEGKMYGVHGEVLDLGDGLVNLNTFIVAGIDPQEIPEVYWGQFGHCRDCSALMRWDVGTQRWIDLVWEEITPDEYCPPLPCL